MTVGIFSQRCLVLETLHHSKLRQCLGQQRMRGVVKILKRFFRGFDKISFKKQKPLEISVLVKIHSKKTFCNITLDRTKVWTGG